MGSIEEIRQKGKEGFCCGRITEKRGQGEKKLKARDKKTKRGCVAIPGERTKRGAEVPQFFATHKKKRKGKGG